MTDIDRQIAEKVMELRISHISDEHTIGPTAAGVGHYRIKPYSTDMNCAMEVVEKMKDYQLAFTCCNDNGVAHLGEYYAEFFETKGNDANEFHAFHDSIPMAICLAAIKVKGKG